MKNEKLAAEEQLAAHKAKAEADKAAAEQAKAEKEKAVAEAERIAQLAKQEEQEEIDKENRKRNLLNLANTGNEGQKGKLHKCARIAEVVVAESTCGFKMVKVGEQVGEYSGLVLKNHGSGQISIPTDGIIVQWTKKCTINKNSLGFPYQLKMKTQIYNLEQHKKMSLEKFIAEGLPTKSVWKYKEFPIGSMPKVLVCEDDKKTYHFGSKAQDRDVVLATIEACRQLKCATLVWVVKYNAKRQQIEPGGLVLLATQSITIPGDSMFCLV